MTDKFDIVVFGATGFTGTFVIAQLYKNAKSKGRNLTWAVAGRSKERLESALDEVAQEVGDSSLKLTPIILANVNDEESIRKMTKSAQVIINCCGPYSLYGKVVVKHCIESGTHHLDISGEMDFIGETALKYSKRAEEKNVYVIGACGADCVPTDLGVSFLESKFEGTLNSVELYLSSYKEGGFKSDRAHLNIGTWESFVRCLGNIYNVFKIKHQLNSPPLPESTPKLSMRFPVHRSPTGKWSFPFLGADNDVIQRTQRYFYNIENKRPVQTHCYVEVESLWILVLLNFIGGIALILSQFKFGQDWLIKYPSLFTAGYFSNTSKPDKEGLKKTHYIAKLYGKGWSDKVYESNKQFTSPPTKSAVVKISFVDPAYSFTSAAATLAAILLLTEKDNLPKRGGVYTTAAALSKTSFIKELENNGVTFEYES